MRTPSTGNLQPPEQPARDGGDDAPGRRSHTHAAVKGAKSPRLPHERDESSDSGTGAPTELMHIAHDDAESERRPTDRSEATDDVYRRTLRSTTPGAERDRADDPANDPATPQR